MAREITAYLCDIMDACDSIASILAEISIETYAEKVIGFRNILTYDYASVDHETVYKTALQDAPKLRGECLELLRETEDVVKDGPWQRSGADDQCHAPEPPPHDSCLPPSSLRPGGGKRSTGRRPVALPYPLTFNGGKLGIRIRYGPVYRIRQRPSGCALGHVNSIG
jgi:uncharacterized protein with HEPN domain